LVRLQNPIKEERQNYGIGKIEENQRTVRNRSSEEIISFERSVSDCRSNQTTIN
jgi:hypothetical protein